MKVNIKLWGFVLLLAVTMPAGAQSLREYIQSRAGGTDSLLLKAITPSLSIVRQQYRLECGGEYFGKNNKPFYGESYTLGVKVSGATILQNRVVSPWSEDADFKRVNQSGKYTPVCFWSFQRSINDSIYKPVDWELDSHYTRPLDNDSLLYKNEDKVSNFGLDIDETPGEKSGYIVWAYSSTDVQDSTMHVTLRQNSYKSSAGGEANVTMTPSDSERILGGVFIVPHFKNGGLIQLMVTGVASKTKEGKWVLHLLSNQDDKALNDKTPGNHKQKDSKKKKNEDSTDDEPTPVG